MRAASLKHAVSIQRQTTNQDNYGQPQNTWSLIANRRASIVPTTSIEKYVKSGEASITKFVITLRYESLLSDLGPNDKIVHSTVDYDITGIINADLSNKVLEVMAETRGR